MALTSKAVASIPLTMKNALCHAVLIALSCSLGACGGSSGGGKVKSASIITPRPPVVSTPAPMVRPPMRYRPRNPQVQTAPGLEGVIGMTVPALLRQFGQPRLDVTEGDARKLQFTGSDCVLDIYLYPDSPGHEPEATWVDARRASDGQDTDRAACIAGLKLKP